MINYAHEFISCQSFHSYGCNSNIFFFKNYAVQIANKVFKFKLFYFEKNLKKFKKL